MTVRYQAIGRAVASAVAFSRQAVTVTPASNAICEKDDTKIFVLASVESACARGTLTICTATCLIVLYQAGGIYRGKENKNVHHPKAELLTAQYNVC